MITLILLPLMKWSRLVGIIGIIGVIGIIGILLPNGNYRFPINCEAYFLVEFGPPFG